MTKEEACQRYQIPLAVLQEYETWESERENIQYNDRDLERLSLITALQNLGFNGQEAKEYLFLSEQEGTEEQLLAILEEKRQCTLREIHQQEQQVCQLDCLRYSLRKKQGEAAK